MKKENDIYQKFFIQQNNARIKEKIKLVKSIENQICKDIELSNNQYSLIEYIFKEKITKLREQIK